MLLPLLFAATLQLQSVAQPAAAVPVHPQSNAQRVLNARSGQTDVAMGDPVANAAITIDGRLDEAVWKQATLLTGFSLYQPFDGQPAPDSTEVLVWYSTTAIHFGIRAFESHGAVRATLAERDRVGTDDNIELHLDTFRERRRAFVFIVNALGVQADGTKSESGGFIPGSNISPGQNDLSADFVWQSKGRTTDYGYEVEVRIPFNSLRYSYDREQRWGLQVNRKVQHSGYEETWTPVKKASASFIAQEGWLTGLHDLEHGQSITVNPELTNTITGVPEAAPNNGWKYDANPRLGGNARVGIGSDFVVNATIRPDFSQVEADATQVATDLRFALFYAERRPFFVEGAELFNAPNTLVYTRRIGSPDGAAKITGKLGRANVAVLSAADAAVGNDKHDSFVNIVRLTADYNGQSTAGVLYSDRRGNGRDNTMASADTRIVFGRLYFAQLQSSVSTSRTNGVESSGQQWEGVVDRTGRRFGFHYGLLGISPGFRADNGFVARTGFVQPSINNRITFFGKQGGIFERYNTFISTSALWRYNDFFDARSSLESRINSMNSFTFKRGWQLTITPTLASFAFDPRSYAALGMKDANNQVIPFVTSPRTNTAIGQISATTPQFRRMAASVGTTFGRDVFFLETSRARRVGWNASLDYRPTGRIRFNTTYVSTELRRSSDGTLGQSSRIPRVKLEYQIARPIFVRLVTQYEAVKQDTLRHPVTRVPLFVRQSNATYVSSSATFNNTLRSDLLFSYRPKPGIVFFSGYGNTMYEPDALAFEQLRRTADGFFLKASYVFGTR